ALGFHLPFCPPPFAGNSAEQTFRSAHCYQLLIQNQGQTLFAKFVGRRTLQRIFAANNFRDVRNERLVANIGINPTTVQPNFSAWTENQNTIGSLLVPCVLIGISLLGFIYLVWDRLH